MGITVEDIARRLNGTILGDASVQITGVQAISKAAGSDLTFAIDEQNLRRLKTVQPGCVLVAAKFAEQAHQQHPTVTFVVVADPMGAFIEILQLLRPTRERTLQGISDKAIVAASAKIGPGCIIHPGATIGEGCVIGAGCEIFPGAVICDDTTLGEQCTIYPNAVIYPQIKIGHRVIIHASAVIGADGFGYRFQDGRYVKIPQLGTVQIGDDVEIGACTTVDRAMIGATIIGDGTKLDNLVMIGHNCELGKHNAFASQVGFAGSVTTGDYVRCAGQVGVADHIEIGSGASLGAKAGVHRDMPGGHAYLGAPATEEHEQLKIIMSLRKLPELRKQMRELEQKVEQLSQLLKSVDGETRAA